MSEIGEVDAIVIGSGAGGAAAANRLVEAGLRVLLCEKGDELPADGSTLDVDRVMRRGEFLSREDWRDGQGRRIRPEEHFNVGGKTRWYGAALFRFSPREFNPDLQFGCRGWPIDYRDLEPAYREAETRLGVRNINCEPDLRRILDRITRRDSRWRASSMPMGLAETIAMNTHEASHFDGFASVAGLKSDASSAFLQPLAKNRLFCLLAGAEVIELLADAADPRIVRGVRLADGRKFFARCVLLAAGALHSPRLLQRYLDANGLTSDLRISAHVGRYLKLHLLTAMIALSFRPQTDLIRKTMVLQHPDFPHSSIQPLGFDGELIANLMPRLIPRTLARRLGARAYGFFLQTEDGSHVANRVTETTEAGTVVPVLDYDESRLPASLAEHRRLTRRFQSQLLRMGMLAPAQRIGLNGTAHACGTLVCGRSDADSVVNRNGRVHGMQGLYVVDGSVLPRSSSVNPSLSIFAWAHSVAAGIALEFRNSQSLLRAGVRS